MEKIEFRKATVDDVDQLVELRQNQLQEEGAVPRNDISESLRRYFAEGIDGNYFISWLAVDNDKIVATSGVSFYQVPPHYGNITGHIAQISNMHTLQGYRRQGIATELLKRVIDEAIQQGYVVIRVNASKEGKYLYKSFGFNLKDNLMEYKAYDESVV